MGEIVVHLIAAVSQQNHRLRNRGAPRHFAQSCVLAFGVFLLHQYVGINPVFQVEQRVEMIQIPDEAFKVFRRGYKKRFAWIKAGRITKGEFYDWSERAREKRDECDAGELTMEGFETWLKQS